MTKTFNQKEYNKKWFKENQQANSMKSTATPEQLKLFSNWIEKVYR